MRLLIVEDDPLLGEALATGLKQRGFAPDWMQDGREAQTAMRVEPFAATVFDLGLPGLAGLDLLRAERARGNKVPVLILTARDAVQDRIKGLDAGADDYVVKPTDLNELRGEATPGCSPSSRNLVGNAIRYGPPGTTVDVAVDATESHAGHCDRRRPRHSRGSTREGRRRFYRAPGTRAPGSGLGQSIVERIVDLHRGRLQLDTTSTGIGRRVVVTLPRAAE